MATPPYSICVKVSISGYEAGRNIVDAIISILANFIKDPIVPIYQSYSISFGNTHVAIRVKHDALILQTYPRGNNTTIILSEEKIGADNTEKEELIVQCFIAIIFKRMELYGIVGIPEYLDCEGIIRDCDAMTIKNAYAEYEEEQAIAAYITLTGDNLSSRESILQRLKAVATNALDELD